MFVFHVNMFMMFEDPHRLCINYQHNKENYDPCTSFDELRNCQSLNLYCDIFEFIRLVSF